MMKLTSERFEVVLKNLFEKYFSSSPTDLKNACEYALFGSGKRIRPTLCFLTADFCKIYDENVYILASAIEFIHNYSLIHDDLPCMDNDDFRRGKPTVHKKFGETLALLAGDALLNTAFEILFDLLKKDINYLESVKIIASYAGVNGMIGGQAGEFVNAKPDFGDYVTITKKKTAGLIQASVLSVAFLSMDRRKIDALSSFSLNLGMIFQLTDDLLDKETGESASFVTILGENEARKMLQSLYKKAENSLKDFTNENSDLMAFCDKIVKRTY